MATQPPAEDDPEQPVEYVSRDTGTSIFDDVNATAPSLGDMQVVTSLVQQFLADVAETRRAYNAAEIDHEAAIDKTLSLQREYAAIFRGERPEFYATFWNTGGQLASHIMSTLGKPDDVDDPIEGYFACIAVLLLKVMVQHENGSMTDDTVQFQIEAAIDGAVRILLGLPPDQEPD